MVIYNLWVEILHWKEDWKFASIVLGGQCATIYLETMMQLQLVISLDLQELVSMYADICLVYFITIKISWTKVFTQHTELLIFGSILSDYTALQLQ